MTDFTEIPSDGQVLSRIVLRQLPVGVLRIDPDGVLLLANDAFAKMTGATTRDAVPGRRLVDVLDAQLCGALQPSIDEAFDGRVAQREVVLRWEHEDHHAQFDCVPDRDDRGVVVSVVGTLTDISGSKRRERERAAQATALRDHILSVVSHELRSPLNGVQSWSYVLENQLRDIDGARPKVDRALDGIRIGIDQQVALVARLLDATAAMAGELVVARGPVVLHRVLEAAIDGVREAAAKKSIRLHVRLRIDEEEIDGDAERLQQLFHELLANAVAFTPDGGRLDVQAARVAGQVTTGVTDSGRGLPSGFESWLFQPFSQADVAQRRRVGGLGLGLAFARRLAECHGGTIEARSGGADRGATFTVTLPVSGPAIASPSPADDAIAGDALDGMRVLVIDDQSNAREALGALLTQLGARVHGVSSSHAGIAAIDGCHDAPDVVICDIAMPEEDGYAFVSRLRRQEAARDGTARPMPVIALSALVEPEAARDGGFDHYLVKPVTPRKLLALLSHVRRDVSGEGRR